VEGQWQGVVWEGGEPVAGTGAVGCQELVLALGRLLPQTRGCIWEEGTGCKERSEGGVAGEESERGRGAAAKGEVVEGEREGWE